jgi:hypothetical protein
VLGYVWDAAERRAVGDTVRELGARWLANEGPGVIELARPPASPARRGGAFILALDREPVAWTDSHGAWLEWLGPR